MEIVIMETITANHSLEDNIPAFENATLIRHAFYIYIHIHLLLSAKKRGGENISSSLAVFANLHTKLLHMRNS